jgi:anti-sigma regulatory factor (Ser/Thr protein kinase)
VTEETDVVARDFTIETLVMVRHEVMRWARSHGMTDPPLDRVVVAVNEIATNAVRHGGGTGRLELWRVGDLLYCRVTDHGVGLSPDHVIQLPPTHTTSGRGLWLAREGSETMTVRREDGATSITLTGRTADLSA